jgi:tRNA threonylcarbamoyladenosine biosynthesis protein TsaE
LSELTTSAAETEALGARIAADLRAGDVVLVAGELGTGKTTLIRGACGALGVSDPVTSPTFTIGHRYWGGKHPVSHLDLYRLGALDAEEPGLLDDYLTADAISFVEWPGDIGRDIETDALEGVRVAKRIELRHAGGDERRVEVE